MNCKNCGKTFTSKGTLKYHTEHNVCMKQTNVCCHCGRKFATKLGYTYHITNQVCGFNERTDSKMIPHKHESEIHQKIKICLRPKPNYEHMSKEELIDQLEQTHDELIQIKGKYESLKENPQNINNNNNIIVFPSTFGKEDMDHIREKLGDILGPTIKNHPRQSIPILFNKIHNNDQLPEYHNVYISSERSNYAMVSDGKSFKYKPKKTIIDQIIEDKRSLLNRYIDDNGDQLGEKVLSKYDKYQDEIDDNSTFRKELEVEIGGLLLDMKSVIANDEKTRKLLEKVNEGQYELDPN